MSALRKITDYEALQALCRDSFGAFAHKAFNIIEPGTDYEFNWHMECMAEHLEACYRGEIKRLIINIPPRSLKSFSVAQSFPAWVMGKNPTQKFIMASYAYSLAEDNVRKCRTIMRDDWYKDTFQRTIISADQDQKHHFETTQGGMYYGAGIGGTIIGKGADYILLDDPLNPKEAMSDTVRATTRSEIRSTLFSRFNDKRTGRFILIMQRLHETDPTGDLLADGGYVHLKLPAISYKPVRVALNGKSWNMVENELLFPKRLTQDILDRARLDMTELHFAGQMLQEPVRVGGGEFKEGWLQWYQAGGIKPKEMNTVILVDAAGGDELNKKKKKTSDWTVMDVIGLAGDNNYYLLDRIRDRLNPTERIDTLFMLHRKWNALTGKSPKVGYEKYGMMTDTHYIKEKQKTDAYNFALVELGGQMVKEERIRRLIPDMQNGRWFFPATLAYVDNEARKFDLIEEMKGEMRSFPRARWDDILDTMSRIYEPELFMTFPKLKPSMTKKAMGAQTQPDNWESW